MLSQQQRAASPGEEEAEQEGLRGHLKVTLKFLLFLGEVTSTCEIPRPGALLSSVLPTLGLPEVTPLR